MLPIRLQKFIADSGIMSRKAADEEIKRGNISVNGHIALPGTKVDVKRDIVTYRGKRIIYQHREFTYIMMNKPRGYLCATSDDRGRKCVTDLLTGVEARVYPVGRLDLISEGMLLLTDDGELKNRLTHPRHEIGKVYRVKVAGKVSEKQLEILSSPLEIDGYEILPVTVAVTGEDESGTVLKMTLFEGRNRQIRKMCEQVGLKVAKLSRIAIGDITLGELPSGKWRYLSENEIKNLKK